MDRNVLLVIHYPTFGGPHNQAIHLNRWLANSGWRLTVLLPDESGNAAPRLESAGVSVVTSDLHRLRATADPRVQAAYFAGFASDISRIRRVIQEVNAEVILIGGFANPQAAIAAHRERIPVVWQILDTSTPQLLVRLLMPLVRRRADALLVTGQRVAEMHEGALDFDDRLFLYAPPVDPTVFHPDSVARESSRHNLGIGQDDFVVGTISNLNPDKDLMTFVAAAAEVHKSQPRVRFIVLGENYPQHRDYMTKIEQYAKSHDLSIGHDLIFHSPGSEVAAFANSFDVFWLTSRAEGLPTCVGEAMALGLPVIATDVGSVREIISSGENGFIVPPSNPKSIAARTLELIGSVDLRTSIASAGRRTAHTVFSPELFAKTHVAAIESTLTSRSRGRVSN